MERAGERGKGKSRAGARGGGGRWAAAHLYVCRPGKSSLEERFRLLVPAVQWHVTTCLCAREATSLSRSPPLLYSFSSSSASSSPVWIRQPVIRGKHESLLLENRLDALLPPVVPPLHRLDEPLRRPRPRLVQPAGSADPLVRIGTFKQRSGGKRNVPLPCVSCLPNFQSKGLAPLPYPISHAHPPLPPTQQPLSCGPISGWSKPQGRARFRRGACGNIFSTSLGCG